MSQEAPSRPRGARAGFSLVELVVAMVILTVGVLGSASVLMSTGRRQLGTMSRAEMTALAQSKLEELRGYSITRTADTLQLAVGGDLVTGVAMHVDTVENAEGRSYIRRWQVDDGPASTRAVTLRVFPQYRVPIEPGWLEFNTLITIQ